MGQLFDTIRAAVLQDRFGVSDHAEERLRERRIMAWQVVEGISSARLLAERPDAKPNPTVELAQTLADGTPIRVVWSWLELEKIAKLVTVYFPHQRKRK